MPENSRSSRSCLSLELSEDGLHNLEEKDLMPSNGDQNPLLFEDDAKGSSLCIGHLFTLTCGLAGLQVVWSVILSQGAPFLVSLGLSRSLTALVWIAGPLCGAFIQPVVGYLSDRSRLSWGQRRPFIVIGAMSTIFSMCMLGWIENTFKWIVHVSQLEIRDESVSKIVIALAVFLIYALNISIQPLQVGLRTLIIENCPKHQQAQASAWASLTTGIGNILGYLVGFAPLPDIINSLCQTRFQGLCIIASMALVATIPITCCFIHEKNPETRLLPFNGRSGVLAIARRLLRTFKTMPLRIRKVFQIQFFAWMGWFPYLFYATTYIGDLYSDTASLNTARTDKFSQNTDHLTSTQIGTFATFLSAIVAFTANMFFQFIIYPVHDSSDNSKNWYRKSLIRRFSLTQIWTLAHAFFAISMFTTLIVKTHIGGTVLIAVSGISWAMTLWAPYAIIGQELAAKQVKHYAADTAEVESLGENQAGLIMSLHNTAISVPQIIAALVCSGIFWITKTIESQEGVAWCLRVGGLAALGAAWTSLGMEEK